MLNKTTNAITIKGFNCTVCRAWQAVGTYLLFAEGRRAARKGVQARCMEYIAGSSRNHRRRQWHPTPVLLPRKSHGRRSLVGCSPWGRSSRTQLSNFTFTFNFHALEKEMATHSSVLAWRILETGKPGGLPSMWSHRVGHD